MNSESTEKVWVLSFKNPEGEREIFGIYHSLDDASDAYNDELLFPQIESRKPFAPEELDNICESVIEELDMKIEKFGIQ